MILYDARITPMRSPHLLCSRRDHAPEYANFKSPRTYILARTSVTTKQYVHICPSKISYLTLKHPEWARTARPR